MTHEDANKWLENLKQDIGQFRHEDLWHYEQAIDEIMELLKEQQAEIDRLKAEQPKKGHWKENDDQNFQCSECGNESFLTFDDVFVYGMKLQKFCSNCGADMRGERE